MLLNIHAHLNKHENRGHISSCQCAHLWDHKPVITCFKLVQDYQIFSSSLDVHSHWGSQSWARHTVYVRAGVGAQRVLSFPSIWTGLCYVSQRLQTSFSIVLCSLYSDLLCMKVCASITVNTLYISFSISYPRAFKCFRVLMKRNMHCDQILLTLMPIHNNCVDFNGGARFTPLHLNAECKLLCLHR